MTRSTLRPDHPLFLAVQQLAADAYRCTCHGAAAAVPFDRQLRPGALDAALAASTASHAVAWQGTSVALIGWASPDGIMLAVADRKQGTTFAAPQADALGVLQLAALAGALVTRCHVRRPLPPATAEKALRHLLNQPTPEPPALAA